MTTSTTPHRLESNAVVAESATSVAATGSLLGLAQLLPDVTPLYRVESGPHHATWVVSCGYEGASELGLQAGPYTLTLLNQEARSTRAAERLCSLPTYPHLLRVDAITTAEQQASKEGEKTGAGVEKGNAHIWYEAAEAGTLADYCAARGPLPVGQVTTVVRAVIAALTYLHANQLTYSSLTAETVVFTVEGIPKLLAPDLDLRGEPEATQAARQAEATAAAAALIWLCYTGEQPHSQRLRAPLPLAVPEASEALARTLEDAIDSRAHQPTLTEIGALVDLTADPEQLELHLSAHESVRPRLPAYSVPEPQAKTRQKLARRTVLGQATQLTGRSPKKRRPNLGDKSLLRSKKAGVSRAGTRQASRPVFLGGLAITGLLVLMLGGHQLVGNQGADAPTPPAPETPADLPQQEAQPDRQVRAGDTGTGWGSEAHIDEQELATALTELVATRSRVLASGDSAGISDYSRVGSLLAQADEQLLNHPQAGQLAGMQTRLLSIQALSAQQDGSLRAEVTVAATGYAPGESEAELKAAGITVEEADVTQTVALTLELVEGRYLLTDASPIPVSNGTR
ncbi:hypothetical protein [Rothia nasisuis]|uniref:hypothetical protein n=1 Tax=Rothia nasisuis TaxID=2109647 RepID=UPI001F2DFCAE|nr:hypothetical protein [Rothia nasisuis]